jgi:hypothetical protein
MKTHIISFCVVLAVAVACGEEALKADVKKPYDTSTWIGSNYTPAYAANQIQMWHEFKPEVIDRELAAAVKYFGLNTLRVYLHNIAYDNEKELLLARIEEFLKICDRHGIKPGFVFFDDCWNHKDIALETPPPVDGRHNGRWAALQDSERKEENLPKFKAYVQDVIAAHREDTRVLWWEIYNEPKMSDAFTLKIRELGYGWAKEMKPTQPVIACWDDHPWTDIVNAHNYTVDWAAWDRQADMNPAKGTVFTEAGARWMAPRASSGSPTEVIHWLSGRKAAGKTVPGVYLCWELMAGNSNCRWYWGTKDNTPEPTIPWCGLLWPDCTPVSYAEAESVKSYATGKRQALFFDDFQDDATPAPTRAGWTRYGGQGASAGYMTVPANTKFIAGNAEWSDYTMEVAVMLKGVSGNAGLVLRVNEPGPGNDQMNGYYVGFSVDKLYLGKMNNNWQELATFDLKKLPCKVEPDVWNRLRVSLKGNQIQVWFNPLHDDPGLRITYTDDNAPILKGCIGVRASGVQAWVDDLIVLP